jgi:D-alanyl-D-alanine carboxypeptidase/D-alanyl-D-alanine-endopeptidase (penicillin-binding protein 4)
MAAPVLASLWLALAPHAAQADAVPAEVADAFAREKIGLDAVSIVVQEVGSGGSAIALNPRRSMNPASVAKLFTTFAALEELGPAFTWRTPVVFGGPLRGGVLEGALHLQGRGDPKLTLERLWLAMLRLRQMGVAEIRGDIVLDQSAFALPEGSTAEFDNEPTRPYNARPHALLLNLSAVVHTFTPDPANQVARVSSEPALEGFAQVQTVPLAGGPCTDWRGALKPDFADPLRLRFQGAYPLACGERAWPIAHPDARQYMRTLLATLWREAGGKLAGTVREGPVPAGVAPAFELVSPPLGEVVRDINKFSNNVMAQQLFLTLALQRLGSGTPDQARALLRRWVADRLGESADTLGPLVIDNGSGLSRETRVSAALLARLLQAAWSSPVMPELVASLPVTGLDGTLRRSKAMPGRAHLKTGSLRDVNALAGYVLGATGKRYVLVAMINHPNAGAARPALDALVQWTMALR